MAKAMYIGINDAAKKIKKAYIGIDGIVRKIKKIYIGVDNSPKLCFVGGGGTISHSTATNLSAARSNLAATSVGNYALFGGGYNRSDYHSVVDAYYSSLTKTKKIRRYCSQPINIEK